MQSEHVLAKCSRPESAILRSGKWMRQVKPDVSSGSSHRSPLLSHSMDHYPEKKAAVHYYHCNFYCSDRADQMDGSGREHLYSLSCRDLDRWGARL